jgi:hypothetical protein
MIRRLFLAATLTAGLTMSAPARAAEIDTLLPSETESVIFVNVKQILASDIVKKYALGQLKQMIESNDDAQKMLKDLGIDPMKDIDRVTAGTWGKDKDDMNVVAIVRGKFDLTKLMAAAEKEAKTNGDKLAVIVEGKYKLIKFTNERSPKPFYASAADDATIVAGTDKKFVINALAAAAEKTKPSVKKELAQLLLKMDEKASMYTCGTVDGTKVELPPNMNIPGVDGAKLAKQLEKMTNLSFTVRITDEFIMDGTVGMKDGDAADDFGDTLNQLIGTVKGFLPLVSMQQPKFKPLADEVGKSLKSKVKDKEVTLMLKISADSIDKAAGGGD